MILRQVNTTSPPPPAPSYKKMRGKGIAETVIGGIFLPIGATLVGVGTVNCINYNNSPLFDNNGNPENYYGQQPPAYISEMAIGASMVVVGTVLIIHGPIKISRALKLKRQGAPVQQPSKEPMELCINPSYNPAKGSMGIGFNLKF